jgi:hypothetical protein
MNILKYKANIERILKFDILYLDYCFFIHKIKDNVNIFEIYL